MTNTFGASSQAYVLMSSTSASKSGVVNADLVRERKKATFSVERMTNLLDGGAQRTQRRRQIEEVIQRDPTGIFSNEENSYLHRTERHKRSIAKHVRMIELCRKLGIGDECGGEIIASKDFHLIIKAIADDLPTALHWIMFVPNIISLCDEEQKAEWLPLCKDWKMIGCYAQTEIGHGSNVRALETTATFLPECSGGQAGGSWMINSPTLTSSKAWPGTLGRTANHAMVIARLIDGDGIDRGIHNFLVPLRSMKDHKLLPGVKTADLGPKIGFNNMDNGFARFDNVLIPRRNMAMKFASVDENGKYTKKSVSDATSKIAYITMMQVRALIVSDAGRNLAQAVTIAIRYSAVRRQGYTKDGKTEMQVLDYRQQQHRLLPLLAASYCSFFTGKMILERLADIERRLVSKGDVSKAEVADIHASTSSLKSFLTTVAADGIEDCRKACGGHGFLMCSGIPELLTTYLQNPTVEGDNQMLPQQVAKVLLKVVEAVEAGRNLSNYEKCDSRLLIPSLHSILHGNAEKCLAKSEEDLLDSALLLKALGHRASRVLVEVAQDVQSSVMSGMSVSDAWNNAQIQISRMSRSYSLLVLMSEVVQGIETEARLGSIGSHEIKVLTDLAHLFALYWIEKDIGDFLEDGYFSQEKAAWVRSSVLKLLDEVRPNAVPLVDAFDISDFRLKSALGRFDGNVYPAIVEAALKDPLNQIDPGPAYEPHLRRLIRDGAGTYTGTSSRL